MSQVPFSRYLPYFATRTLQLGTDTVAFMFNTDGTIFVGLEVSGVDVYAADNARLNRVHGVLQQALNQLPDGAFAQWEWTTGHSFDDVVADYAGRGATTAPGVLKEMRRRRVDFLRRDDALRRGRLHLYIGQKKILPELGLELGAGFVDILKGLLPKKKGAVLPKEEVLRVLTEMHDSVVRLREQLLQVGLKTSILDENGLLGRIHAALNPRMSKSIGVQVVEERDALGEDAKKKTHALYRALTVREQLPLSDLVWEMDSFLLDQPKVLHRALSLQRWPAAIGPDFLFPVQFATTVPLRLVTTMEATNRLSTEEAIVRKRNIAQAMSGGSARDHRAQIAHMEGEALLDKVVKQDQRLFHTSVYAVIAADNARELDKATNDIVAAFGKVGAVLTVEENRQHLAFLNTLPGFGATAPERRSFQRTTENVACVVPYFQPSTGDATRQVIYHTRHGGLRSIGYTTKTASRPNTNTLVLGGSGSGKSFNVAAIFEQACLAEGGPVLVVDVQGPQVSNYRVLCEYFDGTYTALAAGDTDIAFNPFMPINALCERDEAGNILRGEGGMPTFDQEKLRYLSQLVCVMAVPNIATHPQEELCYQVARQCILRAYIQRIREKSQDPPILSDVIAQLQTYEPKEPEYKPLARDMYLQLDTWAKNPLRAKLLNRQSRYSSTSRFQVFDFYGLEKDEKLASVLLLSVAFNIWSTIYQYPLDVTKFILFDECWKLLTHPVAAKIVAELYRTGRKWGASTWAITQNLNDFLQSPIRSDLISNAATVILNQHATDHERVIDTLELSPRHAGLFKGLEFKAGEYSELLHVQQAAKEAAVLRLVPSPFELWLNTSSASDVGFRNRVAKTLGLSPLETLRVCAEHFPTGAPKNVEEAMASLSGVSRATRSAEDSPSRPRPTA